MKGMCKNENLQREKKWNSRFDVIMNAHISNLPSTDCFWKSNTV
jgi:hypothetical protein